MPNPWDVGSAKLLVSLGFEALATTSSGYAATLGRLDGSVTRDEAIEHAATIVAATDLPVSADLENGFADEPDGVAETMRLALEVGIGHEREFIRFWSELAEAPSETGPPRAGAAGPRRPGRPRP